MKDMIKIDKRNMLGLLSDFPEMAERTMKKEIKMRIKKRPENIVIAAMGGSAISGNVLRNWLEHKIAIPIQVCNDYAIPNYVNEKTLVVVISYSGNTEETLSAFHDARKRNAMIVCITSDGKLEKLCRKYKIPLLSVPKGMQPRAALPYLFFSLVSILRKIKLINEMNEIQEAIDVLKTIRNEIHSENKTEKIAKEIKDSNAVIIYAPAGFESVAMRIKAQFNENSKILSWFNVIPEMNHNEITGWSKKQSFSVIFLRDKDEPKKIRARIEFTKNIVSKKARIIELWARGNTKLSKMFSLIILGDFISFYLAILNKVDPSPAPLQDEIKRRLGQI